jgi:hypothetical protein
MFAAILDHLVQFGLLFRREQTRHLGARILPRFVKLAAKFLRFGFVRLAERACAPLLAQLHQLLTMRFVTVENRTPDGLELLLLLVGKIQLTHGAQCALAFVTAHTAAFETVPTISGLLHAGGGIGFCLRFLGDCHSA